jgi:cobalt-zinc-cadmium efflux system outer membrane protein
LSAKLARNPQLARWTAERERRQAALAMAQAQGRPDLTLSAGPRLEGKANEVTAVAGVSLPLPFWNRNQGAIQEARANVAKAAEEQRGAEAKAFAALHEAYQTLLRAAGEIEILERDVLPGAAQAEEMTRVGYEQARFTQLEILEARRTLLASQTQNLRAHADYHKALAEIEALTAAPIRLTALSKSQK